MITCDGFRGTATGAVFELVGKSTDTKPTGKYMGMNIDNGSSFFEIDTQSVKFYDDSNDSWV